MEATKAKHSRLVLGLLAILGVIVSNAWLLHSNFRQVAEHEAWITHTHEVLSELELMLSATKDSETGVRGFLLTNKEEYLEPYRRGSFDAVQHLNSVKNLTTDNPGQQLALAALQDTLNKRLDTLEELVGAFRRSGGRIERNALQFIEGKAAMDSLRQQVDRMQSAERNLLAARNEASERSKKLFTLILLLTTALSVTVILFASNLIRKTHMRTLGDIRSKARDALENDTIAEAARAMTGNLTLDEAGRRILEFLSRRFGVLAGRLFVIEQGELRPVSSFAVKDSGFNLAVPSAGDRNNLVHAAFARREMWEISEVPPNYWHVTSSLGESVPNALVMLPFLFQGEPLGLLELALFRPLTADDRLLLKRLNSTLGVGLNAAQSRGHLQTLLERTQIQSEELQTQQEELRANNEELEQQARALEVQQESLNIKNRELEIAQVDLKQKAADLERSSQYKSEFLAKMSHELRTPLNGLLILATLLTENKDRNLNAQQIQFARSIYNAGNDLLLLINDILDLSKIEARKLTLRAEEFTLEALFESERLSFEPQLRTKGLKFVTDLPVDLKALKLHTDRQRLEQILRNFLSNAVKFTTQGHVTLAARPDDSKGRIVLSVQDSGIGIPRHKRNLIFEAFEQADGSVSRQYGGTGLGLTISRELAALLGGEISLSSEEGIGSTFSLTIPLELPPTEGTIPAGLPIAKTPTPRIESANLALPTVEKSSDRLHVLVRDALAGVKAAARTILVVEDDARFRDSIVEAVRSYGFEVVTADDGELALAILNEFTPSAILLDIKLPSISGLGILEMIKQMPHLRHIPVHIISALEYQRSALRMGALGYLTKPVTVEKVRSALGRIEHLLSKQLKRVLLVEDDERQRHAVAELISGDDIEVKTAPTGKEAIELVKGTGFDCIILDLTLPDVSGFDFLAELNSLEISLPPIVIYTGKDLSDEEEAYLRRYSESIIIKGVRSPERLLDEVNLFLHRVESLLPVEKREMLSHMRSQEKSFEGKTALIADDDIRNIFALTSALEARGLAVQVARDGQEALDAVQRDPNIDIVIMDIMMPKMDGYEAMRRIRASEDEHVRSLPIVALTAKAMKEDHEKCMAAGASDYLPKPVNLDNLTTVLKVWLSPKGFLG